MSTEPAVSVQPPPNAVWLAFNGTYGLMAAPWCPHEGCGWSMPQLRCPEHGNFGMTFLAYRRGAVTWVKAVLDIPREPLPDEVLPEVPDVP